MLVLSVLVYLLCVVVVFYTLSKLRLSNGIMSPGPYWKVFLLQMPVVVLPVIIFAHGFNNDLRSYYNLIPQGELIVITSWLIYGVVVFCLSFVFFEKVLGPYKLGTLSDHDDFVLTFSSVFIVFLLSIIYLKAGDLPILHLGSYDLNIARKESGQYSNYYASMLLIISYFGMAYAGSIKKQKKSTFKYLSIFVFCIGLLWQGSKGPLLGGLLTYMFSYYFHNGIKLNIRKVFLVILFGLIGLWAAYKVTMPDLSGEELFNTLFGRLLVSQMEGYYRALAFSSPDAKYIANWVPFSGALGFDVVPFSRQLMIDTYGDNLTNGRMNSYFLQDAWAALGVLGLIISPIIVSFSITAGLRIIAFSLRKLAGPRFILSSFYSYLAVVSIVGGFDSFPLFRGVIIFVIYLVSFAIGIRLTTQLFRLK